MVRLLVVSAEDRTLVMLERWLASGERRVVGRRDVREALADVLDGAADVAFVDLDGQEAAGARAVRLIRRARPRLPVVVLCGDTVQGSLDGIPGAGVFCTMVKPLDRRDVEDVATSAVRQVSTRRDGALSPRNVEEPMRVTEWMTKSVETVSPETPISEAKQLMERRKIRHLPVVEKGRLVGIVTDRDVRLNLPSPATSLSVWEINYLLARLSVGEVMTKKPITVETDLAVTDAARLMLEHRIGALPVVENGQVVGIVTETDLLRAWVS